MFKIALALLSTFTIAAQAEVVSCSFTEPFINVDIDPTAKTVTYLDAIENKTTVYPATITYTDDVWTATWGLGQSEKVEYYTAPKGGSDGMSDFLYPMEGKMTLTHDLWGGCETASQPKIDPYSAPFPGCYEVLTGVFEDGASYYKAVGEKITEPLKANQKTKALGVFLEQALVIEGSMELKLNTCRYIDEAVK